MQFRVHGGLAQVLVDLVAAGGLLEVQVEDGHRNVRRRYANGVAGQLALQHWQCLGGSSGGAGFGDDHVQRRGTATAAALVEVVDQVLVVGERVNGFDVAVDDAVLVVDGLEHRHDGVGGAGSGRDDLVIGSDVTVVDAVHDVLQRALARCGEDHAGSARAGQVLAQAVGITPYAGVVDDQRVFDAVLGVVDFARALGVDNLDQVAVGGDGVVGFVDGDGAIERAVHRVTAQQAGTLDQIVLGAFAHDDGAQTQAVATTGFFDQDARQQTADTTEAVQHNVSAFTCGSVLLANHVSHFFTNELLGAAAIAFVTEFERQLAQVYRSRAELELAHGFEQWECFVDGEFAVVGRTVARKAVSFENRDDRLVDQAAAIDRAHHVVIAVELTDKRNHRFCECFTVDPFTKTLVGLLSHGNLPHVGAEKRGYIMPPTTSCSNVRLSRNR
ncbi:hypothetical protein D3C79_290400 [compost metagenome]